MVSANTPKELLNVLPNGNLFLSQILYDDRRVVVAHCCALSFSLRNLTSRLYFSITMGKGMGLGVALTSFATNRCKCDKNRPVTTATTATTATITTFATFQTLLGIYWQIWQQNPPLPLPKLLPILPVRFSALCSLRRWCLGGRRSRLKAAKLPPRKPPSAKPPFRDGH